MTFKTNFQSTIMKEKGLLKTYNKKVVKQIYDKAAVDINKNIKAARTNNIQQQVQAM